MSIFKSIKNFFRPATEDQVLGYPRAQLMKLFVDASKIALAPDSGYPQKVSLAAYEIQAYYSCFQIENDQLACLMDKIQQQFTMTASQAKIVGLPGNVIEYKSKSDDSALLCITAAEFEGTTIRLLSNHLPFLNALDACKLDPVPPWRALPGCEAHNLMFMQGHVEYYMRYFFIPFFETLNEAERDAWLSEKNAPEEWHTVCLYTLYKPETYLTSPVKVDEGK